MLINHKEKLVFIAVPKTGTTALEQAVLSQNHDYEHNEVHGRDVHKHISAHDLVKNFPLLIEYTFIGMVRHPLDLLSSKYSFYREGRARDRWFSKKKSFRRKLRVLLARVLPFHVWALIVPYSLGRKYISTNLADTVVLKYSYSNVQLIFHMLTGKTIQLEKVNVSQSQKYKLKGILGKIVALTRLRKELKFYESLQ